jgi:hypothetical protein
MTAEGAAAARSTEPRCAYERERSSTAQRAYCLLDISYDQDVMTGISTSRLQVMLAVP